jgi:hypothetical protein
VYSGEDVLESLSPKKGEVEGATVSVRTTLMAAVTTFTYRRELHAMKRPLSACIDLSPPAPNASFATHHSVPLQDRSSASELLSPTRPRAGRMPELLQSTSADQVVLCDVPTRCVIDRMVLSHVTTQNAGLKWSCTPVVPSFQVQIAAVSSLVRSERGHGNSIAPSLQLPTAPSATSVGPKRCRVLSVTKPVLDLDTLQPSTLYEVVVRVEAVTKIEVRCAPHVMTLYDDAPQVAELRRYFITHPLRPIGHNYRRGVGTVTVILDPSRDVAAFGLTRYNAVRAVPENFIFVSDAPAAATQKCAPSPTLPVSTPSPTFVITSDDLSYECGGTSDLHAATLQVREPADAKSHRLEHFAVIELNPDSACYSQCLNTAAWSEPDVQPIKLLRSVSNPQVAHVSSNRAEIVWTASHENLRFDVSLRNLSVETHDESLQRVIYSRIAFDALKSGSLYGVTITPSHEDVPCRPHSFVFITAPKRQKPPKIHFEPLNAIFDLPPTTHKYISLYPFVDQDPLESSQLNEVSAALTAPSQVQVKPEDGWSLTTTAIVICTSDKSIARCHTAADYLAVAEQQNTFRSHPSAAQRVDIRLRCGKNYMFAFFWTARHPQALNGVVHSKVVTTEHKTDTFPPSHLHVITRSRASVTIGWQSVDNSRETLRFEVQCFALPASATTKFGLMSGMGVVRQRAEAVDPSLASTSILSARLDANARRPNTPPQPSPQARPGADAAATSSPTAVVTTAPIIEGDRGKGKGAFGVDDRVRDAIESGTAKLVETQTVVTASSAPQLHATFSNLQLELYYAFRVRSASEGAPPSPWTDSIIATVMRPPMPVDTIRVVGVTPNSVSLAWTDVNNAALADALTYIVSYRTFDGQKPAGPTVVTGAAGAARRPRSHRDLDAASAVSVATSGASSAAKAGELTTTEPKCEISGLLSGLQYRITVTPRNHLGEICTSTNATITVRTESAQNWRV